MACTAVLWDDANRPTGAGGASDPGAKETRRFFLVPLLGLVNGVAAREEGEEGPGPPPVSPKSPHRAIRDALAAAAFEESVVGAGGGGSSPIGTSSYVIAPSATAPSSSQTETPRSQEWCGELASRETSPPTPSTAARRLPSAGVAISVGGFDPTFARTDRGLVAVVS